MFVTQSHMAVNLHNLIFNIASFNYLFFSNNLHTVSTINSLI